MNIKRYFNSLFLTSVIYSFLTISLLYSFNDTYSTPPKKQNSNQNVKFTLINLPKPIEKPIIEQKKEIVKKEIQKPIKKIVKKINPKKIAPKKIVKKVVPKKKVQKKIVKKTKSHKEPKIVKKAIKKPTNKVATNQIKKSKTIIEKKTIQTDSKQLKIKQNRYYTQIRETIDTNKSYPTVAVRRGIQGEVKIQFTISKTGNLLSFKILDGKKVFYKSIDEAIKKSFPLKPPKDIFTSNLDLKLTLQYKLY